EYLNEAEEAGLTDDQVAATFARMVAEYQGQDDRVKAEASARAREATGLDYADWREFHDAMRQDARIPPQERDTPQETVLEYSLALSGITGRKRREEAYLRYRDIAEDGGPHRAVLAAMRDALDAGELPFPRTVELDKQRRQMWADAQRAEIAR